MNVGWHYVEDSDDKPPLGAATYLDIAGSNSAIGNKQQLCRLYFKGKPDVEQLAKSAARFNARLQLGNELNHPIEQYPGTVTIYLSEFLAFKNLVDQPVYWAPPSPGFPNWQSWLDGAEVSDGIVLHCYGTLQQMQEVVTYTTQRFPGKPIWIGECNFGPAPNYYVDLTSWAYHHLKPFLDWCSKIPEIEAVCYFAYKWPTPDMDMGTPVDGTGTAVEEVLRTWQPPNLEHTDDVEPNMRTATIGNLEVEDLRPDLPDEPGHFGTIPFTDKDFISIHHSVTSSTTTALQIYTYHRNLGRGGIGYNFIILPTGHIQYVGECNTSRAAVGQITQGNRRGIHICLIGNFTNNEPPDEQLTATKRLIANIQHAYGWFIPVVPHRLFNNNSSWDTECPGDTWRSWCRKVLRAVGD